jgi:hypothetical protein
MTGASGGQETTREQDKAVSHSGENALLSGHKLLGQKWLTNHGLRCQWWAEQELALTSFVLLVMLWPQWTASIRTSLSFFVFVFGSKAKEN